MRIDNEMFGNRVLRVFGGVSIGEIIDEFIGFDNFIKDYEIGSCESMYFLL